MAKINLIPWREELRKQKKRDFLNAITFAIMATMGIHTGVYFYIEGIKEYQVQRNKRIENEIAILDKRINEIKTIEDKKKKLLAKIDVIQKLQESRPEVVHLFDEIPKTTPDGIYLTSFIQKAKLLTFNGKTESNAPVSAFMRAIEASFWLTNPKINVIQSKEKTNSEQLSDFTLTALQSPKKKENTKRGKR
ncbi:MAG: PilN domain-containing protein [Gammaproteobacteria bacterium]